MSISDHSNVLASTIYFKCNRKKQDKSLNKHHFPLHLPQKTKHHTGDPHYAASKWYSINFQCVFGMKIIREGGERINKDIGNAESTLAGIIFFNTEIEEYVGMEERLVRGLAI